MHELQVTQSTGPSATAQKSKLNNLENNATQHYYFPEFKNSHHRKFIIAARRIEKLVVPKSEVDRRLIATPRASCAARIRVHVRP